MPLQDSVGDSVREQIATETAWYPVALDVYDGVRAGDFSLAGVPYEDLFLQSFTPRDPEVAGFLIGQIHAWLASGRAVSALVEVGAEPLPNAQMEENERLLRVPEPFSVWVRTGKGGDDDGVLSWDRGRVGGDLATSPVSQVPLEIGRTDIETLWFHFHQAGGFARWPFGRREIIMVAKLDPVRPSHD